MKILIVNTVPTEKNGITNVIYNNLIAMDKKNMSIDLVTINEPEPQIINNFQSYIGRLYILSRNMKKILKYLIELFRISKGYDVIHVHGNSATMVIEMLAAKMAGVSLRIAHSHSSSCTHKLIDRICRIPFYLLCNGRIACSQSAGLWLYGKLDFKIIDNGIDSNKFSFNKEKRLSVRNELGWENCIVIGHVGNFIEAKNHLFLVDMFEKLYEKNSLYRLLLLGKGEKMQDIKNKVSELSLSNKVCFMGSKDNVCDYLCAMDLIVMPSLFEGLPLALIEEQANGLPCIISDSIPRESDKTGYLHFISLKSGVNKWVETVLGINTEYNRERRSKEGLKAIISSGYDIKKQSSELEEYYLSSLQKI